MRWPYLTLIVPFYYLPNFLYNSHPHAPYTLIYLVSSLYNLLHTLPEAVFSKKETQRWTKFHQLGATGYSWLLFVLFSLSGTRGNSKIPRPVSWSSYTAWCYWDMFQCPTSYNGTHMTSQLSMYVGELPHNLMTHNLTWRKPCRV